MYRRCQGTPPAGRYDCPNPATHWQVRIWGQGTMHGEYPVHLEFCAEHAAKYADRKDVQSQGSY